MSRVPDELGGPPRDAVSDARPRVRAFMHQRWHDLLFAHWPVPAPAIASRLPAGLELDTFEGRAWLGVVPFRMSGVRLAGLPPLPGAGAFPELNLRTYVRRGDVRGVWFFSLDAASRLAVEAARLGFGLPYFHARMSTRPDGDGIVYSSERTSGATPVRFEAGWRPISEVS